MALRMSRADREAFLAQPRIGIVGIEEAGRSPRVVPIWYGYEPEVGVSLLSNERSRKTGLLRAAGKFSLCVQDTTPLAYRHVSVQGPIVEERPCEFERDFLPLATRYLGADAARQFATTRRDEQQVIFIMRPEHWVTADYRGAFDATAAAAAATAAGNLR